MSAKPAYNSDSTPWTITCPRCVQTMRIAPEHAQMTVECPHCQTHLEPQRATQAVQPHAVPQLVTPPYTPHAGGYTYPQQGLVSSRNKWVAGLLGVFLGEFGIHRFYLGYTGIGILQIILTIVTFGIAGLWGFVEGFLCFFGAMHDVDGLPLQD